MIKKFIILEKKLLINQNRFLVHPKNAYLFH